MPTPIEPDRSAPDEHEQRPEAPVAPPRPPADLPTESTGGIAEEDHEAMRRADAANGEPGASE